ncbi:MAG: Smr/MutS family protein [Myxococcota bacterium]|nr:Smr/MutS family protein [Myxococcota bacterium]
MATKRKAAGPFESLRALKEELRRKEEEKAETGKRTPPTGAPSAAAPPPRSSTRNPAAADVADDEALLLHRTFAGVTPLDRSRGRVTRQVVERSDTVEHTAARAREGLRAEAEAVHEHLRVLVEGDARFEVSDDGHTVEGRRLDLPRDAMRRLRRGLVPVDARMDLHGLGVDQARAQLGQFLGIMRARGERCVLVIHGKGEHSPGGVGVLRGEIAAWLSQSAASEHVAGFATAADHDGGQGAVYVLLRR